jgi:hypothetical protein
MSLTDGGFASEENFWGAKTELNESGKLLLAAGFP